MIESTPFVSDHARPASAVSSRARPNPAAVLILSVVTLLALTFLGTRAASAQDNQVSVVGTVYYEEQPNPRVRVTFRFTPNGTRIVASHSVVLDPIIDGQGQLPHFVGLDEGSDDGLFRVVTEPTVTGIYDIVVQTHFTNGTTDTTRRQLVVERPPTELTVVGSGEGAVIAWKGGYRQPTGGYEVTVIDSIGLTQTTVSGSTQALLVPFVFPGEPIEVRVHALHDPLNPHNSNVNTLLSSPSVFYTRPETPVPPPADPGRPAGTDLTDEQLKDLNGPPEVTITAPTLVNRYEPATFTFSCVDITVAICEADLEQGSAIPTNERGSHTYRVTAADGAGNIATKSITIVTDWTLPAPYAGIGGARGVIARYYVATFGRLPDKAGFAYWADQIERDPANTAAAAWVFINSPEYRQTYGSLDDGAFIDQLYLNVLGRLPDVAGRAYWLGLLGEGSNRSDTMHVFTNSPEHRAITGTN